MKRTAEHLDDGHFADGTSIRATDTPAMFGISAWRWRDALAVAGQECAEPSAASSGESSACADAPLTVLVYDMASDGQPRVLARDLPAGRPPGPIIDDALQIEGGSKRLMLDSGDLVDGTPFAAIGGLPCGSRSGLVQVGIDISESGAPTSPESVSETPSDGRRAAVLDGGLWETIDPTALTERLAAGPGGVLGCIDRTGPLVWSFDQGTGKLETFIIDAVDGETVLTSFAPPVTLAGVPVVDTSEVSGAVAVMSRPVDGIAVGGDGEVREGDVRVGTSGGWRDLASWMAGAGRGRWAMAGDSAIFLERTDAGGWITRRESTQ